MQLQGQRQTQEIAVTGHCLLKHLIVAGLFLLGVPAAAHDIIREDVTIKAVTERPIRFYIDRPDMAQKVPLVIVVDGSGCVGQLRQSSWGNYAPRPDDQQPFARLMVEKPGVEPTASDFSADCSEAFLRSYSIDNRVFDHLRVLQHLAARAAWWNGDIYVWGWSDGGDIAAQLVIYRPDIKRAVLGAMGGGLTMAEHFEDYFVCPPERTPDRATCLAELRTEFRRIEDNPTWRETWSGKDNSLLVWSTRLRSRLSAPLADNTVPLLIVHGELDRDNTPVASARKLVEDLRASDNRSFSYWEIAGMEHGWRALPEARKTALLTGMLDWLLTGEVNPQKQAIAISGQPLAE
jgi:pimeloyl-ACP methyl ester carboxylesterase